MTEDMQLFWGEKRYICSLVIFLYLRPNRDSLAQSPVLLSTDKMEPKYSLLKQPTYLFFNCMLWIANFYRILLPYLHCSPVPERKDSLLYQTKLIFDC